MGHVAHVADHQTHDHGAHVGGKGHADLGEEGVDVGADAGGDDQQGKGLHNAVHAQVLRLAGRLGSLHALAVLLALIHHGVQIVLLDLRTGDGSSHQGAGDQTVGGAGHRHNAGAHDACILKLGPEGTGGSVSAHQGDGAHAQAQTAVQLEHLGQTGAHQVLNDHHDAGQEQEHQHRLDASSQHLEAGAVAHTGEEPDHEGVLQGLIEGKGDHARGVQGQVDQGEHQAAHDRGGDAHPAQKLHVRHDDTAEQEENHCQRGRLHQV